MELPSKIRFTLVNGVSNDEIKSNDFIIYAHVCTGGIYVGMSNDPVKRWQEHWSDAFNESSHNYDDEFRIAIRKYRSNIKHYVLGTAKFEKAARNKEAAAIKFYKANLNMKLETDSGGNSSSFRKLENQIGQIIFLETKGRKGTHYSRSDKERTTVIGEIYTEFGRKRIRAIEGQKFDSGMNIECSRSERERFNNGDKVKVNVAISEKLNGRKYLVAAKTSKLILVK